MSYRFSTTFVTTDRRAAAQADAGDVPIHLSHAAAAWHEEPRSHEPARATDDEHRVEYLGTLGAYIDSPAAARLELLESGGRRANSRGGCPVPRHPRA